MFVSAAASGSMSAGTAYMPEQTPATGGSIKNRHPGSLRFFCYNVNLFFLQNYSGKRRRGEFLYSGLRQKSARAVLIVEHCAAAGRRMKR